jgi:hypothetical protein
VSTNLVSAELGARSESSLPATSYGPIIAGALASCAVGLVLGLVGAGMGLIVASPEEGAAHAIAKFTASTAIAFVVIQWLASAVGGYVTGRLRTRWADVHDDEIFFRDTVHGFLSWALSTLLAASLLGVVVTSTLSGGAHVLGAATSAAAQSVGQTASAALAGQGEYWTDELLRTNTPPSAATGVSDSRPEIGRILMRGLTGETPQADKDYLAQRVAASAGVDPAEAKKRVDAVEQQIEDAKRTASALADETRKTAAATAMMTALALAIGAFIASAAAALGGQRRDA